MRNLVSLLVVACAALGAAGCAANANPQPIGSDPRDVGVVASPGADSIPLLTTHGVRGCRMRQMGGLAAPSLLELRDQAHQKLAHAVIDVRRQTDATMPGRTPAGGIRPAAVSYYVGTAVRFDDPTCLESALTSRSRLTP